MGTQASTIAPQSTVPLYRLDVDTYNRVVESGALDGRPIELIDGLLIERMSPQTPKHATVIARLSRHFAQADAWLRVQLPLEVSPVSEPEPDLALVEEEPSPARHTRTARLVVEVSVSTHELDRGVKAALYATAGIPTYWLIDVSARVVEVRTDPDGQGYRRLEVYRCGAQVPSPASGVPDLDVVALLGDLD